MKKKFIYFFLSEKNLRSESAVSENINIEDDSTKENEDISIKEKNHILFAPSWNYNKNNLFEDHCIDIINKFCSFGV